MLYLSIIYFIIFAAFLVVVLKNIKLQKTYKQYIAMASAITYEDDDAVRMMIGKQLDPNREFTDWNHDTLIDFAIRQGRIDYLKWFAEAGAKGLEWTADVPDGEASLKCEVFKAAKARYKARRDALDKQDRLNDLNKLF